MSAFSPRGAGKSEACRHFGSQSAGIGAVQLLGAAWWQRSSPGWTMTPSSPLSWTCLSTRHLKLHAPSWLGELGLFQLTATH